MRRHRRSVCAVLLAEKSNQRLPARFVSGTWGAIGLRPGSLGGGLASRSILGILQNQDRRKWPDELQSRAAG